MQVVTVANLGDGFDVGVSVPGEIGVKWPTNTFGQAVKTSSTGITAAANVFQDMALSIMLPAAGTYLIMLEAYTSAVCTVATRLFNVTQGAAIANSERIGAVSPGGETVVALASGSYLVAVDGPTTIRLEASRNDTLPASVLSSVIGRTVLTYVRVA